MKRLIAVLSLFAFITLGACKKDKDGIAYSGEYEKSYRAWLDFQAGSEDSYMYQVESSSWTGYSKQTTITVKQGKIIERSYSLNAMRWPGNVLTVVNEWKEDATQLGTHNEGHELLTLEELYQKAKSDWLLERFDAKTYFETDNNGMISVCGYSKNGCADDCFNGVRITFIRPL
ncbi:hypothetical protein FAM09_03505 [Niastella caeni]|uniref:Lipoprotein n=1 Tax=Niastella caeni TaxID=2569763 RepID=A0A4S8I442_9BACT|nr:hypothetical protein [Niastella caeni]THU41192.1 hypothetical protein FAM09_03505 [Niastella caeni]